MSIALNEMGLGGSASHSVSFDPSIKARARKISFWKEILWNRLDKGDYCFFAMKEMVDDLGINNK